MKLVFYFVFLILLTSCKKSSELVVVADVQSGKESSFEDVSVERLSTGEIILDFSAEKNKANAYFKGKINQLLRFELVGGGFTELRLQNGFDVEAFILPNSNNVHESGNAQEAVDFLLEPMNQKK